MIKVLIVDDHTIMRQGLRQILADTPDIVVAGEAQNGREALEKVQQNLYDVVLLDIAMPEMDGVNALDQLKQAQPSLAVLVLSMYPEEQYAVRLFKEGAAGYLTKESATDELISAIHKVANGGKYMTLSLAERLAFALDTHYNKPLHESLSNREFQVMQLLASGKTVSEIATALMLSVKTVSTYRTRILEKLGLKNTAEIILYAVKNDLIK
jgi:DNA-binding NarL/FixJ family response regulator